MRIVVYGSGSWGSALANVLADNGMDVTVYGRSTDQVIDIDKYHQNSKYFGDIVLNYDIKASNDLTILKNSDIVILSVPSNNVKDACLTIKEYISDQCIIVNTAKGFDMETFECMHDVIRHILTNPLVSLIGPSHAEEVVLHNLTTICCVGNDEKIVEEIQKVFSNNYFRVYACYDEIGAQIGVALKNVIAIASGILVGLGLGDNAKAALITRGLAEIVRYGTYRGGKLETFLGLTGIGDLIVTCISQHSRNYQAGLAIGEYDNAKMFLENNTKTVEGINACKAVYLDAKKHNIPMPIVNELHEVLYDYKVPSQSINDLMNRKLKEEFY
ncbi:MAG: NAD(P)H-dependent glycerol-3-phosphate dehydrogenase [Erysipelotrichaceae bacterium]